MAARNGVEFVAQCLAGGGEFHPRVPAVRPGPVTPNQAKFLQPVNSMSAAMIRLGIGPSGLHPVFLVTGTATSSPGRA